MPRKKKQQIEIEIVNPEALEAASINLSKALVDIWWNRNVKGGGINTNKANEIQG